MCNNILLNNRVNIKNPEDIFEGLIKKDEWITLLRLFSLNILDINFRDCKGRNILYFAILNKKYEYIKTLFDLSVSSQVNFHLNALNFSVCLDDTKALEILLKCGLDINTLDEIGSSALIYSILYKKKKCMDFLLLNGADINLEDFMGNCAKDLIKR
ncbi:ankyrin domain-containing protein [Aliarcobacter faecis]|uniref:ankyrin repeat domain-containing protein n=1 Tax=Aliarcobacter faecis TaxID=1564138 RepID=UPI00047A6300|nr:ankyrin repeat domain-containing protein [Aliarcobacter faecis]QKF74216.1 ankyrin domain-containing protein [Aliarcobacter faecis]